jgi:hypothetical protein
MTSTGKKWHYSVLHTSSSPVSAHGSPIDVEEGRRPEAAKKSLSIFQLMMVLKPYFWPNEGSDGAFINRLC